MLILNRYSISFMILYVIILHFYWAILIMVEPTALNATPIAALARYIHPSWLLEITLTIVSILAFWGMISDKTWIMFLLIPQQILLYISAAGAIEAMWIQQYADGVQRGFGHISGDQIHVVLAAMAHTGAIIAHVLRIRH